MQNREIMTTGASWQPILYVFIYNAHLFQLYGTPPDLHYAVIRHIQTFSTCFTLLFLQNHQRPDFFGIFSLTQASSVACQ